MLASSPIGSNGWVIAGAHTADGAAILASDMHLPLSVPGIWYRMSMEVAPLTETRDGSDAAETTKAANAGTTADTANTANTANTASTANTTSTAATASTAAKASTTSPADTTTPASTPSAPRDGLSLHGLTLPGAPGLIVGSNGHVAWGFTNVEGDFIDFVVIERDPADPSRYLVPGGSEPFEVIEETIRVGSDRVETLTVRMTRWGPVTGADHEGRPLAIMWTAMQPNGLNLGHLRLGRAMTAAEALEAAAAMRGPQQNVVIADRHGSIAWTISG
jgi:acyl-homoserine lactone acylase PvdQ